MNWVGGSRSRFMKNSDRKKQKEFFEKKRRQKKLNQLEPPASPKESNSGNIDLLTMFIVNQIALKKEHTGKPKVTHLTSFKGAHKSMSLKPLELPMSPCSPSHLSLVESEPCYSVHTVGLKKRKQSVLEEFRFNTLSPVLEAKQSDNSASDYKQRPHRHQSSVSSFSSASPTPSEAFQSKPKAHISPPPSWESSLSAGVCEYDTWPVYGTQHAQNNSAATAQFESILHSPEKNGPSINLADEYPANYSIRNIQQEEPLFLKFNTEEHGGQGLFGERMIKIHLQKETSPLCIRAHDSSESPNRDQSADFFNQPLVSKQGPKFADYRPCSTHSFLENACEIPVSYSPQEGCISSNPMHYNDDTSTVRSQYCCSGTNTIGQVITFSQKTNTQCEGGPEETTTKIKDMGTQTADVPASTLQDASVQCCLLKVERKLSNFSVHKASTYHNRSHRDKKAETSTTRRHTGKSNQNVPNVTQCALSEIHKVNWNTPCKTLTTREATQQATEAITEQQSSYKSKSRARAKKQPILDSSLVYALESNVNSSGNMMVREERCEGHEEESVNQNPARNAWSTEEHGRERGVNRVSGETETLQEIADILLMLKQKNKH